MSSDRLLLAGIWTIYILVGSYLKDERLAFYAGQAYRDYQTQVTGFPFVYLGPLAKRKRVANDALQEPGLGKSESQPHRMAA